MNVSAMLSLKGLKVLDENLSGLYVVKQPDIEALVSWLVDVRQQVDYELGAIRRQVERAVESAP